MLSLDCPRRFLCLLLAIPLVIGVAAAGAEAKPRLDAPSVTRAGHGIVIKGSGFKKRSTVALRIGPRQSEAYFVERFKTDRHGRFRTVQRVAVTGRWVWVAHGRSGSGLKLRVKAHRSIQVKPGARIYFEPSLGVTAGTPFHVHGHGWDRANVSIQARRGRTGSWRAVGRARAAKGSIRFRVAADNRVFNHRTRVGDWQFRACTNHCRVAQARTRLAEGTFRIGEP